MDKSNEHKPTPAAVGPGSVLRKARTDLQMTTEDAAAQLHLAPRQVVALESDDYASLPQPTYVRGYLRSYSLLLGLAPEPILNAYNEAIGGRKPPRLAQVEKPEHTEGNDGLMKWGSVGIAVLVLALVFAWWKGRETEPAVRETAGVAQPAPGEAIAPPGSVAPAPAPTPLPPELTPQAAPPQGAATAAPPVPGRKLETPAVPAQPSPQVAKPGPAQPVAPAPQTATPAQKPVVAAPPAAAEERRAKLVLQADVETWAEVRDARQTRLIYETIPAGRIVGLEGVPPFQVFLGNVDGVKVFYDGRPFDAARYKRGTTARFSVGKAQTGSP